MPRRGSDAGSAAPLKFIRIDDGCCLYTLHSRSRTPIPRRTQETTQVALCVWVHLQRPKTQAGTKDLGNEPSTAPLHRKRGGWERSSGRESGRERASERATRNSSKPLLLFVSTPYSRRSFRWHCIHHRKFEFAFELAALLFCFCCCHSACKPRESGSAIRHQVEKQIHTTVRER